MKQAIDRIASPIIRTRRQRGKATYVSAFPRLSEVAAIKVVMLLADRETASLGDPFSQELLSVKEHNITGDNVSFSSLEQNIPGFSLMFVLLTLIFSVSLALREEEVWGTSADP